MKWVFALNESSNRFQEYANLAKAAVVSAYRNTSLEPYCIYDGEPNELTGWLESRGVTVIPHRTSIYEQLKTIALKRNQAGLLSTGAGAFLRIDIPIIAREAGWADEIILYTDVDILFVRSCDLEGCSCRLFAVAPEFGMKDFINMNSGVMLMNMRTLGKTYPGFKRFVEARLETVLGICFDQLMYRSYYHLEWDNLGIEYNWKPYWGANPDTHIIHFHGPKPTQRQAAQAGNLSGLDPLLFQADYLAMSSTWDEFLQGATQNFTFKSRKPIPPVNPEISPVCSSLEPLLLDEEKNQRVAQSAYSSNFQNPGDYDWREIKGGLALDWYMRGSDLTSFLSLINYLSSMNDLDAVWVHMQHRGLQNEPTILKRMGIQYAQLGQNKKARDFLALASTQTPDDLDILVTLGRLYFDQGDYPNAVRCLQKATQLNPNDPDALRGLELAVLRLSHNP